MGFAFRKSFKLLPGIKLNVTHRGVSASVGGGGFTANIGRRGIRGTASIPGSGLSYSGMMLRAGSRERSDNQRSSHKIEPMSELSDDEMTMAKQFYSRHGKTRVAAFILLLLGLHYLYFGKIATWVLFVLSLGGFFAWWFIDIFRIGSMVDAANEKAIISAYNFAKSPR